MSFKNFRNLFQIAAMVSAAVLVLSGCASDPNKMGVTNPNQPGPAAGRAVGGAVGGVVGNTAGFVAGVGEGAAAVTGNVFNTRTHVVRQWQYVTTSDGRTIQVPVDIVVDENGVPLKSAPAPKDKEAEHESLSGKAKEK
ncbi:MAG: flagellar motor protein MotB [Clostridia bacterium]|nr:flagellar motor protein MotB [Clostridia bacterium]